LQTAADFFGRSKGGTSKPPMALQGQSSVAPSRSESKEGTPSSQYGGGANKPYRGNQGTSQRDEGVPADVLPGLAGVFLRNGGTDQF